GVGTFGSSANGLTIGAVGFYGGRSVGDLDAADGIALLGGYESQPSTSGQFRTENYVFILDGGNGVINGVGLRFFGDRLAADLAIVGIGGSSEDFDEYEIIPVPYFGFAYNF